MKSDRVFRVEFVLIKFGLASRAATNTGRRWRVCAALVLSLSEVVRAECGPAVCGAGMHAALRMKWVQCFVCLLFASCGAVQRRPEVSSVLHRHEQQFDAAVGMVKQCAVPELLAAVFKAPPMKVAKDGSNVRESTLVDSSYTHTTSTLRTHITNSSTLNSYVIADTVLTMRQIKAGRSV